jgi:UDP-N-acetylglucosamine 4,6-dehydratase/5-epimerase
MSTLMITGGTGSLGNAIVERVLAYSTFLDKIIVYSRDEQKQEQMYNKFKEQDKYSKLRFFIGDVRDSKRLSLAMRGVNWVVHAAALKIVPLMESNPFEAVKTNIMGTQNVIDACLGCSTLDRAVFVSSDKATMPVNIYGASKLCAEKMWAASNNVIGGNHKYFRVVRYGNVTGSRGSVIPLFAEQKRNGLPATVTSPESTRYWLTLDDAVQLVYKSLFGVSNEVLQTLEMPAYSIQDLVEAFGFTQVKCIGMRPGEKIHESILTVEEAKQLGVEYTTSETVHRMSINELKLLLTNMGYI